MKFLLRLQTGIILVVTILGLFTSLYLNSLICIAFKLESRNAFRLVVGIHHQPRLISLDMQ